MQVERKQFHADLRVWTRVNRTISGLLGLFILVACVIGQIRGDRFPAWPDLAIGAGIPFAIFAVFSVLGWIFVRFFPVTVFEHGIRAANYWGIPKTVRWEDFRSASAQSMYGLDYVQCDVRRVLFSPMIPLWIDDLRGLRDAVIDSAGPGHPLSAVLASRYSGKPENHMAEPDARPNAVSRIENEGSPPRA